MKIAKLQYNISSRPPLERMLRIHQALEAGKFPNATTLAKELEVTTKTIQRDLEFMRDRLNLPVEFERVRNGYYYGSQVSAFPSMLSRRRRARIIRPR